MRTFAIMNAFLFTAAAGAGAQTVAITEGQLFQGGTSLHAAGAGIRFRTPPRTQSQWESGLAALAIVSPGVDAGGFLWGLSHASADDMMRLIDEFLRALEITASPSSDPVAAGGWTRSEYATSSASGEGHMVVGVTENDGAGNGAAFIVFSQSEVDAGRTLADRIAAGLQLEAPSREVGPELAPGTELTATGDDSMFSRGGAGTGSYASRTTARLALCHDSRYAFESATRSVVSVDGAGSIESDDNDAHEGSWVGARDLAGRSVLLLRASDERRFAWLVERVDGGYIIDGVGYTASTAAC